MNTLSSLLKNLRNRTPVGSIEMFAGASAPTDWLVCDGSAVSRTAFSSLFSVIGTTYGAGDGSTTFNLPDMRDRVPIGAGSTYSLNANGGDTTHTHTTGDHTLTSDEIPSHNHGERSLTGSFGVRALAGADMLDNRKGMVTKGQEYSSSYSAATSSNYPLRVTNIDATHTHNSNGGGAAHNHGDTSSSSNMMPYRGINFIIYAGKSAS